MLSLFIYFYGFLYLADDNFETIYDFTQKNIYIYICTRRDLRIIREQDSSSSYSSEHSNRGISRLFLFWQNFQIPFYFPSREIQIMNIQISLLWSYRTACRHLEYRRRDGRLLIPVESPCSLKWSNSWWEACDIQTNWWRTKIMGL